MRSSCALRVVLRLVLGGLLLSIGSSRVMAGCTSYTYPCFCYVQLDACFDQTYICAGMGGQCRIRDSNCRCVVFGSSLLVPVQEAAIGVRSRVRARGAKDIPSAKVQMAANFAESGISNPTGLRVGSIHTPQQGVSHGMQERSRSKNGGAQ